MIKDPRIIFVDGEINASTSVNIIIKLLMFDAEDKNELIRLYINSNGGSIDYGLAIYDTIKHISAPVSTICYGMAASMGAFLLSCGKKGERYALPHSRILIHQPLISLDNARYAQETAIRRMSDSLLKSRTELERIMAENIGVDLDKLHNDCERDNWMSAEESLSYGIIDGILSKKEDK